MQILLNLKKTVVSIDFLAEKKLRVKQSKNSEINLQLARVNY